MEPILTLRHVEFRRGEFVLAIDHLDLFPERIYLLEGSNGAGKSTLLHLLALLLLPQKGELRFGEEVVDNAGTRQRLRRQITLVEQTPFLFDTTVYQNLAFGLRLRDVRGDLQKRRIDQALEMVGLAGFAARRARALSGGETRRVALARALVLRPRLFLLDEPTADLDREAVPIFEKCLVDLHSQGTTVVIAGHDADMPRRLAGETIRLDRGRLTDGPNPALMPKRENA